MISLVWTGRPVCLGPADQFGVDRVISLPWTQCPVWSGKRNQSGLIKKGHVGYCLTYFFFGWLVPIVRGEIGIGVLHLVLTVVSFGAFQFLIMPYLYNKQYMTRLLTQGWQLHDSEENTRYAQQKLGISA